MLSFTFYVIFISCVLYCFILYCIVQRPMSGSESMCGERGDFRNGPGGNWCWTGPESGVGVGFRSGTESRGFMLSTPESQELVDILPKMV